MLVPFHRDHMCGKESPHASETDVAVAGHRKGLTRVITVDFQCEEPPRNMLYCGGFNCVSDSCNSGGTRLFGMCPAVAGERTTRLVYFLRL